MSPRYRKLSHVATDERELAAELVGARIDLDDGMEVVADQPDPTRADGDVGQDATCWIHGGEIEAADDAQR